MKDIRYGILGPGYIAPRFVEAVSLSKNGTVVAVASQTENKASQFAKKHDIALSFNTYTDLCQCEDVDVVYISTRHNDHYDHIMLALTHNKHVLVEKPMVLTKAHATACFNYAKKHGLFLMEAQKMVFLPLIQHLKKKIDQGIIGDLRLIETSFSFADRFSDDHWMISFDHGGGLYATASYGLSFSHFFANSFVKELTALASLYDNRADRFGVATLLYDNNILAHTRFGTDVETRNRAYLYGSKGYIVIDMFWKNDFAILNTYDGEKQDILVDTLNDMVYEIDHVNECINESLKESPIMSSEFSITLADNIEQIKNMITLKGV